ncbi:MAG: hypothetical protein E7075_01850 [Bacteroidales bacterium]|nr:hypothetical protein [Bacteroidales bacterium]
MAEVTFETTVQKTVIEVEDMTGTPVNVETTPEVSFSVENGNAGGGGSYTLLTDSEYEEFKLHMRVVTDTILPNKMIPETGEK